MSSPEGSLGSKKTIFSGISWAWKGTPEGAAQLVEDYKDTFAQHVKPKFADRTRANRDVRLGNTPKPQK